MIKGTVNETIESADVLGQAICDYYHNSAHEKLWIHKKNGLKEEMPVAH
jgi:hypothetical protein